MRRKDKIIIPITPEIIRAAERLLILDTNKSKCFMGEHLEVYAELLNKSCALLGRLLMKKLLEEKIIRYEDIRDEIKNVSTNSE